jgi:hypothetical protein
MADPHAVFDQLVAEHGMTASTDLAIAMTLARVMCSEDIDPLRAGETIARLKSLLPAQKVEAKATVTDDRLHRLDDRELLVLQGLGERLEGARFLAPNDVAAKADMEGATVRHCDTWGFITWELDHWRDERDYKDAEISRLAHELADIKLTMARHAPTAAAGGDYVSGAAAAESRSPTADVTGGALGNVMPLAPVERRVAVEAAAPILRSTAE